MRGVPGGDSFVQELLAATNDLLVQQERHPFILALGAGDLPERQRRTWLEQDFLYLLGYEEALEIATRLVSDPIDRGIWERALKLTREVEIPQHFALAERSGLPTAQLRSSAPLPVTAEYTDFLLNVARTGWAPAILASHLPCAWDYSHLGHMLLSKGLPPPGFCSELISTYAAVEFRDFALLLASALDRHALGLSQKEKREVADIFGKARAFEVAFWDACWLAPEG